LAAKVRFFVELMKFFGDFLSHRGLFVRNKSKKFELKSPLFLHEIRTNMRRLDNHLKNIFAD
jgi:hypothetical protein